MLIDNLHIKISIENPNDLKTIKIEYFEKNICLGIFLIPFNKLNLYPNYWKDSQPEIRAFVTTYNGLTTFQVYSIGIKNFFGILENIQKICSFSMINDLTDCYFGCEKRIDFNFKYDELSNKYIRIDKL